MEKIEEMRRRGRDFIACCRRPAAVHLCRLLPTPCSFSRPAARRVTGPSPVDFFCRWPKLLPRVLSDCCWLGACRQDHEADQPWMELLCWLPAVKEITLKLVGPHAPDSDTVPAAKARQNLPASGGMKDPENPACLRPCCDHVCDRF